MGGDGFGSVRSRIAPGPLRGRAHMPRQRAPLPPIELHPLTPPNSEKVYNVALGLVLHMRRRINSGSLQNAFWRFAGFPIGAGDCANMLDRMARDGIVTDAPRSHLPRRGPCCM